jgi:hypothetical protein
MSLKMISIEFINTLAFFIIIFNIFLTKIAKFFNIFNINFMKKTLKLLFFWYLI